MTRVRPLVVMPPEGLDPTGAHRDLAGTVETWLRDIERWYDRQYRLHRDERLAVSFGEVDVVSAQQPIDLTQPNPWYDVYAEVLQAGYRMGGDHHVLALLAGWSHPQWGEWAAPGLAVVGEMPLRLDAQGQRSQALYVPAHGLGHCIWRADHSADLRDLMRPYAGPFEQMTLEDPPMRVASVSGSQPTGCVFEAPAVGTRATA